MIGFTLGYCGHRTQDTDEQHILIIATEAGTGRTTLTILKLDKSVDVSPITLLAKKKTPFIAAERTEQVRPLCLPTEKQSAFVSLGYTTAKNGIERRHAPQF